MVRIISQTVRAALFSTLIAVLAFSLGWMEEDVLFIIVYLGNDPNLDLVVKMGERSTPLSHIVS